MSSKDASRQAMELLPEVERFLADLASKDAGTALSRQADLLSKIRAINGMQSSANQKPANGHMTPSSPGSRTERPSSSEVIYDDTDAVAEAGRKLVTSSLTGQVMEEEDEVEYEDVTEYRQDQGQKKDNAAAKDTIAPVNNADIVAAEKAASDAIHSGYLEKRSKSQVKALWSKLAGGRRWCVMTRDTLYYYDKNTSKQQLGSIHLADYQCTPLTSESTKKPEFTFMLTGTNKKTHTFAVTSSEDLSAWMEAMHKVCRVNTSVKSPADNQAINNTCVDEEIEEENIYDEMPADAPPPTTHAVANVKAASLPVDRFRGQFNSNAAVTPLPTASENIANSDADITCDEDIYDDALTPASPPLSPADKSGPPPLPSTAPPLPVRAPKEVKEAEDPAYPPLPPRRVGPVIEEESWPTNPASCLFLVKCEWAVTEKLELACRRGQVLQLVSKRHESEGWWTMTDGHVTGLVPCTYVTAAFTSLL